MSRDGNDLFFAAAGKVWVQPLAGGSTRAIYESDGFARDPTPSPDGRRLALVDLKVGTRNLNVLDLASGEVRTLASGGDYWQVAWHPDGEHLAYVERGRSSIVMLNLNTGEAHRAARGAMWLSRPRFSGDGRALWYTRGNVLYRISLAEGATAEPVIPLADLCGTDSWLSPWAPVGNAVLSPDERSLAFRCNAEIWLASLDTTPPGVHHARRLSRRGGRAFDFEPDGSAVVFFDGNEAWRQPLTSGDPERIALQVEVHRQLPPPVLLRNVRLLDFTTEGFGPETSVLVDSGRIRGIGAVAERSAPNAAVILDAAGRFAIPGLFDFHVHGRGGYQNPSNIAHGVTSVRDLGSSEPWWLNTFDDWSDAGGAPVPRSFHAGEMVYGPPEILATEEHARAAVRRSQAAGASLIKVYSTLPWSIQRAVADEARLLGLPVAAHGTTVKEVTMGATLGYATLEHAGFRYYDDVLQMLAEAGTRWDPTVGNDIGDQLLLEAEPQRVEREDFRAFTPAQRVQQELAYGDTEWKSRTYPTIYAQQLASIGAAFHRGVGLLAGTDTPEHLAFAGVSLHWELEHLARAGIPPLDVLRIATQEAASAVGAGADLGSLEPGKFGDLILLDANPLEEIRNTQAIWRVIKGGWVFDPAELRPQRD
jgi:imidazolonepropionase-like amidohydrolase